ncbi:MAG: VanZ family protein [Limisphaerales bacterium]
MMFRKAFLLAATFAALTIACFSPVHVRVDGRFWGHVFDVGHIPMWAWLAAVLLYALPERVQPAARRNALSFALALACAVGVELLQPYFGRTCSLGDVINDAIGSGLALTGIAAWRRSASRLWRGAHTLAVAGCLIVALWPAYEEWRGHQCIGNSLVSAPHRLVAAQGKYGDQADEFLMVRVELA